MGYRHNFKGCLSIDPELKEEDFKQIRYVLQTTQVDSRYPCADEILKISKDEINGIDGTKDGWAIQETLLHIVKSIQDLGYDVEGVMGMDGDDRDDLTVFYVNDRGEFRAVKHEDVSTFLYTFPQTMRFESL